MRRYFVFAREKGRPKEGPARPAAALKKRDTMAGGMAIWRPVPKAKKENRRWRMKLEQLTYDEMAALDHSKAWLLVPAGPYEQHGTHLPVSAAVTIASYLAESVCDMNRSEGNDALFLEAPPAAFAPSPVSAGFGVMPELSPKTYAAFLEEILASYASAGFRRMMIVAHHFDLRFIKSVLAAVAAVEAKFPGIVIVEPLSAFHYSGEYLGELVSLIKRKRHSDRKEDEALKAFEGFDFKSEIHADVKATSLMLYLKPRQVRSEKLPHIKPFIINPTAEFLKMNFTYRDMRSPDGHVGTPSRASAHFGESVFRILREFLHKTCLEMLRGEAFPLALPLHIKAILTVI